MIKLPQVTLVAMTGLNYQEKEHKEALAKSSLGIEFGDIKLIQLEKIKNINDWNKAIIYDLPNYIDTDYCLLIHSDGYIRNPQSWQDKWLEYDYIGAPWPLPQDNYSYRDNKNQIQRVGNSVSLRSKRLLQVPLKCKLEWKSFHGYYNEDGFISVNYRHIYEEEGCKFAPLEEAVKFGIEHELPEHARLKPFTFHQV